MLNVFSCCASLSLDCRDVLLWIIIISKYELVCLKWFTGASLVTWYWFCASALQWYSSSICCVFFHPEFIELLLVFTEVGDSTCNKFLQWQIVCSCLNFRGEKKKKVLKFNPIKMKALYIPEKVSPIHLHNYSCSRYTWRHCGTECCLYACQLSKRNWDYWYHGFYFYWVWSLGGASLAVKAWSLTGAHHSG